MEAVGSTQQAAQAVSTALQKPAPEANAKSAEDPRRVAREAASKEAEAKDLAAAQQVAPKQGEGGAEEAQSAAGFGVGQNVDIKV